ncbi:MAG: stage III sporulation protein AG [Clostridiales bacterium]|nr:stage III sporulation protein AG [Clostridiales bacterium]
MQAPDWKKGKEFLKRFQYVGIALLAGVLLLVIPISGQTEQDAEQEDEAETAVETFDVAALEERLATVIGQIENVGEVEVLVTLSASSRQVLATDETVGESSTKTETVLTKDGSTQQSTVTVQTIYPTYQGVLVVCDGGNDATVKLQVLSAVKALTGLSSEQISICARAGGS